MEYNPKIWSVLGYDLNTKIWRYVAIIKHKEYLDQLISFKDKEIIKVDTEIRRCGKFTLM